MSDALRASKSAWTNWSAANRYKNESAAQASVRGSVVQQKAVRLHGRADPRDRVGDCDMY